MCGCLNSSYVGYMKVMENKMETTIVYWGYNDYRNSFQVWGFRAWGSGFFKVLGSRTAPTSSDHKR